LRGEIGGLRAEMHDELGGVRAELGELRGDVSRLSDRVEEHDRRAATLERGHG
jgi:hypothetical protein